MGYINLGPFVLGSREKLMIKFFIGGIYAILD